MRVVKNGVAEDYLYNADNERVRVTVGGDHTFYFGAGGEETGTTKRHAYAFNGQVIAERDVPTSGASTFRYLHGDHLGSVVATSTSDTSPTVTKQYFMPWGEKRQGNLASTTDRDFTGQRKDGTGLLFYNARYYDPELSRFISPDTIVPGMASGKGGMGSVGVDSKMASTLTVDFHEGQFAAGVGAENAFTRVKGFSFESDEKGKYKGGPPNPQALNRYSYVLNNPIRYVDPTGHEVPCHTPGCGGMVWNDSDKPVEVVGDRKCDAQSVDCGKDGYETVSVILQPGENSAEYGIVDADYVRPVGKNKIDGHGRDDALKLVSGTDVIINDDDSITMGCHTPKGCFALYFVPDEEYVKRGLDPPGWYEVATWKNRPIPVRRIT